MATQVSGSRNIGLSLQRRVDGAVHRAAVRQHAGKALHDGAGRVRGNAAYVAHRGLARRRDGLLGLRKLHGKLVFQLLALGFRGRVQLLAGLVADGLGTGACGSQFGLVRLQRRGGGVLQLLRFRKIAFDRILTRIDHATDARQRNARHDQIERDKRDDQRHQLRSVGRRLERRKSSAVAAFGFGVGAGCLALWGAMTLSHGVLLLLSCAPPGKAARRGAAQSGTNSSSSAISSEKMPSASVTAKPKIRLPNWPWAAEGLRTAAAR